MPIEKSQANTKQKINFGLVPIHRRAIAQLEIFFLSFFNLSEPLEFEILKFLIVTFMCCSALYAGHDQNEELSTL